MNRRIKNSLGFTLIELMVIVVVLAVTLSLAVPAVQELIKNNRVTGQTNEMLALVSFARNEAIRRNVDSDNPIILRIETFDGGWSAEVQDPEGDGAAPCTAQGALRCATNNRVNLEVPDGSAVDIVFNNRGYLDPFDEILLAMEHVDCTAGQFQRRLILMRPTGQVESCRAACGSDECE